ncbi:DNA repair exonuclease [Nannocystis sp. SCPEA4]|uniref:metallophosphoesterase family protein n=1 Tax=Nannocystis sp. SCPEA4 TaxID=2996787 RepID=UPI002270D025|nr:DNA repair exonuclease [Nannocystis sp. SCPEA4]MCY1057146.1 DNA repair exonuclease [Nannocystis sp. SCPEA4]
MRVIHAADLHIDSPLRGLGRIEGAPVDDIRLATRRAFSRLVDTCLEDQAALLILAGDVFDGEWRDFNTGLFFVRELARLRDVGTRVVMVRGNHDAESVLARHIPLPEHVHTFPVEAAGTLELPELGLAVHGQSYGNRSVEDNLAEFYPERRRDLVNIGVLHTNAIGAAEHSNYAPCTVQQLVRRNYDYWALGHVHKRSILHSDPWVVYPGNLQGRHAHEAGPRGCTVFDVDNLKIRNVAHRDLDVLRWAEIGLAAANAADTDDLLGTLRMRLQQVVFEAGGRPVLARVLVDGATHLHSRLAAHPEPFAAQARAIAADLGDVWIEQVRFRTRPPAETETGELLALHQALRDELQALATDPSRLAEYGPALASLGSLVAPYLGVRPDDPERLAARLSEVEALLLGLLAPDFPGPRATPHLTAQDSAPLRSSTHPDVQ